MTLLEIKKIVNLDKLKAERLLLDKTRSIFPELKINSIQINQSKVSLNSVNGNININSKDYFFKFHVEESEEATLSEYYRSELLKEAGYNVLMPVYKSTKPGEQILIYPLIKYSTMFDLLARMDRDYLTRGKYDKKKYSEIINLEDSYNQKTLNIYLKTLKISNQSDISKSPLNQLFFNRLINENIEPRLKLYYLNNKVILPDEKEITFKEFSKLRWNINGSDFNETLEQLIEKSIMLLNPKRLKKYPVVTGHGDEHNGNKFITKKGILLFDPAFADNNQYALLSPIKTLFHDTLAHPFWLYSSNELKISLSYKIKDNIIFVKHDFDWDNRSPIRKILLESKINNLFLPLLKTLKEKNLLEKDWQEYIRKALFCCPFLVYNLIDYTKFDYIRSLFALSQCMQVGNNENSNIVNRYLNQIKKSI